MMHIYTQLELIIIQKGQTALQQHTLTKVKGETVNPLSFELQKTTL